ncbi:MAG: ATP phosphoribosyltransferase regulatory subunit [Lachnospiraceae bacterium]
MEKKLVHTPEGVRDIYGKEYKRKLVIEERLHRNLKLFGYDEIQTPTFEFFDVFSKEIGTTPSNELYKFFDKEGNTLALRPDFTPSIARCAAKYFMEEELPIRFSYVGNTFTNTSYLQGKLKETTQMGAELINDDSIEADAEIIAMLIDSLLLTGLKDFQVSIGQVDYFRGLCQEFSLKKEEEDTLRNYISNKNFFAAEEFLNTTTLTKEERNAFLSMGDLFGNIDVLQTAKAHVKNEQSVNAIEKLLALYEALKVYNMEQYVSFDLGMLSNYNYYTGMIFKVYTYGVGDAVVKGGRYDSLLSFFGKKSCAVGFVIVIDDLLQALMRQNIKIEIKENKYIVLYDKAHYVEAVTKAKELRSQGDLVELILNHSAMRIEDIKTLQQKVASDHFISLVTD